jgi:hypothetical protein
MSQFDFGLVLEATYGQETCPFGRLTYYFVPPPPLLPAGKNLFWVTQSSFHSQFSGHLDFPSHLSYFILFIVSPVSPFSQG